MMDVSSSSHDSDKENIPPPSEADVSQVQPAKQHTVLGVLSENEQQGRSFSQGSQFSKHGSVFDSSQMGTFTAASSSSSDVYVKDSWAPEKVADLNAEASHRQIQDLSSGSCQDISDPGSQISEMVLWPSHLLMDIHQHLRESEMKFSSKPDYLELHRELSASMRAILVDWMVEIADECKLNLETLHLAVNYMDRFLSCTARVKPDRLQLISAAVLVIAAKSEELTPPTLKDFVYITDKTYTIQQLVQMENLVLKRLDFNLMAPTTIQFLCLYIAIHSICANTQYLAMYLAELSLLEMDPFLKYTPSIVAAGAYCLARYTVQKCLWPDPLHTFAGYTLVDIVPCLTDLHKLHVRAESHDLQAIRNIYKKSKYCHVATIPPVASLPFG